MPLNKDTIGRRYAAPPFAVERRDTILFALACGEDNAAYFDERREGGIIAPPMFAARFARVPVTRVTADPEVGLRYAAVVHYSQRFQWLSPVRPGDVITSEAVVTHVDIRENGGVLGIEVGSCNQRGEPVVRAAWELFDKSAGAPGAGKPVRGDPPAGRVLWIDQIGIRPFQTFVYAEASGDSNPIHLDDEAARRAGLPGIIVHGMLTMALARKAAVDSACPGRDPLRLTEMSARFARPIFPGQSITLQGVATTSDTDRIVQRIIARDGEGRDVLRDAVCRIEH
jgi:acyl dehydratase